MLNIFTEVVEWFFHSQVITKTHTAITRSKLAIETLEQSVKYVKS